ncbi:MAG: OB-fold domain-containing protein [Rhodococcus sp. (in: high G+C Gram-positive bacteria)]
MAHVPEALIDLIVEHGRMTVEEDYDGLIADFLPDRVGQLLTSAKVPADLIRARVISAEGSPDGEVVAVTKYTDVRGESVELRACWVPFEDSWRVARVRNIPETPPWMNEYGPSPDGVDQEHWAGLANGELRLQRCGDCTEWIWAPRPMCPHCRSLNTIWETVDPAGRIYSWTRTWQNFSPETAGHLPYVVVLVELAQAGSSRVLGVLEDTDGREVRIGMSVQGKIDTPPPGTTGSPLVRWHVAEGEWE